MNKVKKNKTYQLVSTIFFIAVFLYAAFSLGNLGMEYYDNRKVLGDIQAIYDEMKAEHTVTDEPFSFDELLELNDDIVGWVSIDDTSIDYPILLTNDNDYYLTKNYLKEESRAGSIFMDYHNDIYEEDLHTVLYGHRMKDGSMFAHLKKFLKEDFFNDHPVFQYETLEGSYEVEIFSVYKTTVDFDYIKTEFDSDEAYMAFVESVREKSLFQTDVAVNEGDRIITLSTCDYNLDPDDGRLVLHGKLVKK